MQKREVSVTSQLTLVVLRIGTKGKERQRRRVDLVCNLDSLVKAVERHDGPDGTKALLDHHAVLDAVHQHGGRFDPQLLFIRRATHDDLALGVAEHLHQTVMMALVDDARQVAVLGALGHKRAILHVELINKLGERAALNEHVVVRQTQLAGVQALLPQETPGSELDVAALGDEGWIQTAELQKNGGERLRRLCGNNGTRLLAASEHDLVELVVQDVLGLFEGAVDAHVAFGVEILVNDSLDDHGGVGRQLRWLEDDAVAGGNGADEGRDVELERVVEGADDEDLAERLVPDARLHGPVGHGQVDDALILGPRLELVGDVDGLVLDPVHLGEVSLELGLAHVLHEGLFDERGIVDDAPVQLADLLLAKLDVLGLVGAVRLAQKLDLSGDGVERRGLKGRDGPLLPLLPLLLDFGHGDNELTAAFEDWGLAGKIKYRVEASAESAREDLRSGIAFKAERIEKNSEGRNRLVSRGNSPSGNNPSG